MYMNFPAISVEAGFALGFLICISALVVAAIACIRETRPQLSYLDRNLGPETVAAFKKRLNTPE